MDIGMLWFDNDNKVDLNIKIMQAATFYQKKYGQKPNLCYVHPCMISSKDPVMSAENKKTVSLSSSDVKIKESIEILPNHFWIGVTQKGP